MTGGNSLPDRTSRSDSGKRHLAATLVATADISLTNLGRFTRLYQCSGNGAPPYERIWLAHAFITKSDLKCTTTAAHQTASFTDPDLNLLSSGCADLANAFDCLSKHIRLALGF